MAAQNIIYTDLYSSSTFYSKNVDVNLPVGNTSGTSDVTNLGSASYAIPIAVPPGTDGVVPNLSISYNSNSGNSVLGNGWNIAGLSVISRSVKNIYYDGVVKAVDLTAEDRFALDGQRLALTGTYGVNSTEYGTEEENFARIYSYNTVGTGPQWFKVITKDGITMEYGNTTDSRFLTNNSTKL